MEKILPRLKEKYSNEIVNKLREEFNYSSVMEVPRLEKICINQGCGAATQDKKVVDTAVEEISLITGQKPVVVKAKKSVSNFKLREGMPIGVKVTLRKEKMWEFLDRLVAVALPRVRDFRGVNDKSFDGRGNFTMGVTEQIIFPEIDLDRVPKITGLDITFVTTAKTDQEANSLLTHLGMPFKNKNKK